MRTLLPGIPALAWPVTILLLAGGFVAWTHARGLSSARTATHKRTATWSRAQESWDESAEASRTRDDFRTVSGVVLGPDDLPVVDADVALIDLERLLDARPDPIDVDSAIPADCVEARRRSDSRGAFRFEGLRLGPKAILARHAERRSTSRRVWRVLDGIAARACDAQVMDLEEILFTLESGRLANNFVLIPVFDALGLDLTPPSERIAGTSTFRARVPAGSRPRFVRVTDRTSGAVKIAPVEYRGGAEGTRVRIAPQLADVPVEGLPDGEYSCVVDDLDVGILGLCTLPLRVKDGRAGVPFLCGRIAIAIRGRDAVAVARLALGSDRRVHIDDRQTLPRSPRAALQLPTSANGDSASRAEALASPLEPVRGSWEDRLSLMRRGQRRPLLVDGDTLKVEPETAFRTPVLQVESASGAVWRGGLTTSASGEVACADLRRLPTGTIEVSLPWAHTWATLVSDDGVADVVRAPASGRVLFRNIDPRVPFVVFADEGPYGWNRYAVAGGCESETTSARTSVSAATERPRLSSRVEIYGFVRGRTLAKRVRVYCQPASDPRRVRMAVCHESPFFDFVLEPRSEFVVVAWPTDDERGAAEYLKAISPSIFVAAGDLRRIDVVLGEGTIRLLAEKDWTGVPLALVRRASKEGESARDVWTWTQRPGVELRNVPDGTYEIRGRSEDGEDTDAVSREFTITGSETVTVALFRR